MFLQLYKCNKGTCIKKDFYAKNMLFCKRLLHSPYTSNKYPEHQHHAQEI